MSYCGAIPVDEQQSESHILIEACLARVRQDARLDEEPVLPPLHMLVSKPESERMRLYVGPSSRQLPSAGEIVKSVVKPVTANGANAATRSRREKPTARTSKSLVRRMRWPVLLCGFVAGIFGGMAVMKSPVGEKPAVKHVVKQAQTHAASAYAATAAAKSRLARR